MRQRLPLSISVPIAGTAMLFIVLSACSVSAIVSTIGAALAIAEQAAAITGVVPPEYAAYVSAASECIAFASEEEATADSGAVKADKITARCAQLASVSLPPGTAQNLTAIAARLAAAIQNLLAALPSNSAGRLGANDLKALAKMAPRAHAAAAMVKHGPY